MTAIQLEYPVEPLEIACFSDLHMDSPHHDRTLLIEDLERAKERNARIFLGGDIATLIYPGDKRFTGAHGRRIVDAAVDAVVAAGVDLLTPYADLIDLMCIGNHEVSLLKIAHTDVVNRIRAELQRARNPKLPPIRHGGYTGFLTISFINPKRGRIRPGGKEVWYYHHGAGGNAPVTRGAIDLYRVRAAARADVYWLGHKHTDTSDIPVVREVDSYGNVWAKKVLAFFTAGYEGNGHSMEYEKDGYEIDWPEETFYHQQSQGCAHVVYIPTQSHGRARLKRELKKFA